MSRKIKIYILRKDGIVQKYRIKRRNLEKYVKVSYRKKEKRWIWQSKEKKIEKELKRIKRKIKKEKLKEFKKPRKMVRQVWHIKLVYDSKKRKRPGHDIVRELRITTIREKPLDEDDIKEMIDNNIDAVVEPLLLKGYPVDYTDVIIGLEEEEVVESDTEETKTEVIEVHRDIQKALRSYGVKYAS